MGCGIHLKLEKRVKKTLYNEKYHYGEDGKVTSTEVVPAPTWEGYDEWRSTSLTYGRCWSDRLYGMFARLAGVRDYYEGESHRMVPDRGFPEDACNDTKTAYSYIVVSDESWEKDEGYYENSNLHYVKESRANKWLEDGSSKEMKPFGNTQFRKITGPDWYSPNWCTTEEMKKCIYDLFWNEEKQCWIGDFVEWLGLLGAMEGIEKDGYYECRAVFWFDN